jgi:hypothetical protein
VNNIKILKYICKCYIFSIQIRYIYRNPNYAVFIYARNFVLGIGLFINNNLAWPPASIYAVTLLQCKVESYIDGLLIPHRSDSPPRREMSSCGPQTIEENFV